MSLWKTVEEGEHWNKCRSTSDTWECAIRATGDIKIDEERTFWGKWIRKDIECAYHDELVQFLWEQMIKSGKNCLVSTDSKIWQLMRQQREGHYQDQ